MADYVAGIPCRPSIPFGNGVPVSFLMSDTTFEQPLAKLEAHTAAMKFDFAPPGFDNRERMFIAAFGSGDPATGIVGKVTGSKVVALDLNTGEVEDFAYNKARKPAGRNISGLNHPIDAKFGPDGSLYVVDFGVFEVNGQVPNAVPKTGMVWRIYKQRSEYAEFGETMAQAYPVGPDYAPRPSPTMVDSAGRMGVSSDPNGPERGERTPASHIKHGESSVVLHPAWCRRSSSDDG